MRRGPPEGSVKSCSRPNPPQGDQGDSLPSPGEHAHEGRQLRVLEGLEIERYNLLNPDKDQKKTYVEKCLGRSEGPILAASDYMRMNSDQIRPYINKSYYSLGTDGFGRSDTRTKLRKFFEVDKEHIVAYGLSILAKEQLLSTKYAQDAIKKYNIDPEKPIPTKL